LQALPFGQVIEVAGDSVLSRRKADSLDTPVVGFGSAEIGATLDRARRVIRLAGCERMAES
jgi:hypothetical protein